MQGKPPKNTKLTTFKCKVILPSGKIKYAFTEFAPIVQVGEKKTYIDKAGNKFEYDLIHYKNRIYTPKINFELFSQDERKFSNNLTLTYWNIFKSINDEITDVEELTFINEYYDILEKKDFFKKHLIELNISHKLYYNEFDEIYLKNSNQMTDITADELKFIKLNGFRRITRQSAFLVLLHRHNNEEDFLLKDDYDMNNEESMNKLYDKFYNAYKQDKHHISLKKK